MQRTWPGAAARAGANRDSRPGKPHLAIKAHHRCSIESIIAPSIEAASPPAVRPVRWHASGYSHMKLL
jgi:hypothetical protein